MPKGFVYILECSDGSFYTGSTIDLEKRISQHNSGQGANHTRKRLPVTLVFVEEFNRIDDAFYREKQIQGWNRNKKIALIKNHLELLPKLAECQNESHYKKWLRLRSATKKQEQSILNMQTFYSPGKLLLTAEYVVLDGAKALAVPTVFGQHLKVEPIDQTKIIWTSFNKDNTVWFEEEFTIKQITSSFTSNNDVFNRLIQILNAAQQLNPNFLSGNTGFRVSTSLEFPKNWGLGTSSTLINNIAQWAEVDAYSLLDLTFGGSGYDIACAQHHSALIYQLENKQPQVDTISFNPSFSEHLYFVHLNKKQNSREGIAHYKANKNHLAETIQDINALTDAFATCDTLNQFQELIDQHESIIGKITNQRPVKEELFKEFKGSVKSLGAWGGDFILVASKTNPTDYFKSKGFDTILKYDSMVLNK
ncbi:GYDIA family GHMP kinase [Olleya aquimaris]|uniref:Putative GIY-YIG superfamily endonuclease n=1 Tax=Olleya aquimaris TaxID=639310 RepID=A0A327RMZ0_9FLAO|nr:GYDIA family GHMP kinase [Olleya aquimaris]RAJ15117.1 putative GIY-YIG superfamily endonuclease [Olleya aquimaris]